MRDQPPITVNNRIAELEAVNADLRRQLEAAQTINHDIARTINKACTTRDQALADLAEARRDTERLDWLERETISGNNQHLSWHLVGDTLREDIDAARKDKKT